MVGPIGLDAISERWHLQPDVTYENTDEIPAKELVVRSVEERCAEAVYLLEMRLQNAENDQQRLDILAKLEPILNGHCSTPEKAISLPKK
ncbi:hypothetical protein DFQ29_003771, partial [Apophysomyces sp. BC1021]